MLQIFNYGGRTAKHVTVELWHQTADLATRVESEETRDIPNLGPGKSYVLRVPLGAGDGVDDFWWVKHDDVPKTGIQAMTREQARSFRDKIDGEQAKQGSDSEVEADAVAGPGSAPVGDGEDSDPDDGS